MIAIIGTAAFMMAAGTVWYSDLWAGARFRRIVSLSPEKDSEQRALLIPHIVLTGLGYVVVLSITTMAMLILAKSNLPIILAPLSILLVVLHGVMQGVIWEGRTWRYFVIVGGFYTVMILGGASMIWYWPW